MLAAVNATVAAALPAFATTAVGAPGTVACGATVRMAFPAVLFAAFAVVTGPVLIVLAPLLVPCVCTEYTHVACAGNVAPVSDMVTPAGAAVIAGVQPVPVVVIDGVALFTNPAG